MFAHELGIDIWDALDAAATKPFGYMRFNPGPGVGGHCLPVDPSYLSWRVPLHARPAVAVHRAGQRHQHGDAHLRGEPSRARPQRAVAVRQGPEHPAPRAVVQEEHRRCARVPGAGHRQPARRPGRQRQRRGSLPPRGRRARRRRAWSTSPTPSWPRRTPSCCSSTTTSSTSARSRDHGARPRLPSGPQRSQRRGAVNQLTATSGGRCDAHDVLRTRLVPHACTAACPCSSTRGCRPTGAFLGSWCQFPDNSGLDLDALRRSDFVLISHDHQDHFDLGFLRTLSPATVVVVPRYRHPYARRDPAAGAAEPGDHDRGP